MASVRDQGPRASRRASATRFAGMVLVLAGCGHDDGLTRFNSEPDAEILAPTDGATLAEGATVTLRGAASDANDAAAELLARWFVEDTEVCAAAAPAADGTATCAITLPPGPTLSVRLEVVDPDGAAASDEVRVAVTTDAAPLATITGPAEGSMWYADEPVLLEGRVSDAEDPADALTVWWEDGGVRLDASEAIPAADGTVSGVGAFGEGAHVLTLHVRDRAGNESVAGTTFQTGPANRAPDCAIVAPADDAVGEVGDRVDFVASVSDADIAADSLTVTWESDKDGLLGTSTPDTAGNVVLSLGTLSDDTHRVTLTVSDERGATCVAAITYTVDTRPTLTLEAPADGAVVAEGEPLTFQATVWDADDLVDDLEIVWESDIDGVLYAGPPDATGASAFVASGLSRGTHALAVTVTDPDGLSASTEGSFVVNGVPTAPGVTLTPVAPEPGDALTCAISTASIDPDGAAVAYRFTWEADGVAFTGAIDRAMDSTVAGVEVRGGAVWTCRATASDATATSAAGEATVTVADDLDGDGYAEGEGDCDDGDATVSPSATEICGDGVDNDCDSATGDGGSTEVCNGVDDDCDGVVDDVSGTVTTQAEADALADCIELDGLAVHLSSGVVSIDLPLLERVDGTLYFHGASGLTDVSLPALTEVTGYVYFWHDTALASLDLGALTTVGGYMYLDGNSALATVDIGALTTVGGYVYFWGNAAWCVPGSPWSSIAAGGATVYGNLCN